MRITFVPRSVQSLPATARLVYAALEGSDALTMQELSEETGASKRGVEEALRELRDHDLVTQRKHPEDGRRRLYSIQRFHVGQSSAEVAE